MTPVELQQKEMAEAIANGNVYAVYKHLFLRGKIVEYYATPFDIQFYHKGFAPDCITIINMVERRVESVQLGNDLLTFQKFIAFVRENYVFDTAINWVGRSNITLNMEHAITDFCDENSLRLESDILYHFGASIRCSYGDKLFKGEVAEWADHSVDFVNGKWVARPFDRETMLGTILNSWEDFIIWITETY